MKTILQFEEDILDQDELDNKQSPEPDFDARAVIDYVAPKNDMERALVKIWSDVLGIDQNEISIEHNFFEIGGHSLVAAEVMQRIRNEFNKELTIRKIFENPSIAKLSVALQNSESPKDLSGKSKTKIKSKRKRTNPLLTSQFLNWILECNRKVKTNNVSGTFTIDGFLDIEKFKRALNKVAKRHDTLWYPFSKKKPVVFIEKPSECQLELADVSSKNSLQQKIELDQLAQNILHRPFDLSKTPLLRIALVMQEKDKLILLIGLPHIVSDYASIDDFITEIFSVYRNDGEKDGQWQRTSAIEMVRNEKAYMKSKEYREGHKYWKEKLKNRRNFKFRKDFFLPNREKSGKKALTQIHFDSQTANRMQKVAAETNVSEQIIILALIKATLHTLSGENDISLSMIFDSRSVYDTPPVMNMNVMSSVIRAEITENTTYAELLNYLKWCVIDAHANRRFPITVARYAANGLTQRIIMSFFTLIGRSVMSWRYRNAQVNKEILSVFIALFIRTIAESVISKVTKSEDRDLVQAPGIVYNVLPNFYKKKTLWTDEELTVSDMRDIDLIMNPGVFEENSEFPDSIVLNIELARDANDEMTLLLYGGRLSQHGFSQIKDVFLKHLEAMLKNPFHLLHT